MTPGSPRRQILDVGWALALVLAAALPVLAAQRPAQAQPAGKVHRIGMLEVVSPALNAANLDAFRQGLRELGYVEGQNLVVEYRSADGRPERFPALATELVRLRVDLIVTRASSAALAARNATKTTPIVMASIGDPLGSGVVASLARPGGNVTGLSAVVTDLAAKRVELLREMVPGLARIVALLDMSSPIAQAQWNETESAAASLGVQPQLLDLRRREDLGRAFEAAVRQRADALIVSVLIAVGYRPSIAELAVKHRLPAMSGSREFVDAGGLISYGVSYPDLYRRAATFVDRILKGARPADLPIEQPTKFELAINLKTAKALGLTVPPSLLLRADHLIQ